jgi:hypothetical protein
MWRMLATRHSLVSGSSSQSATRNRRQSSSVLHSLLTATAHLKIKTVNIDADPNLNFHTKIYSGVDSDPLAPDRKSTFLKRNKEQSENVAFKSNTRTSEENSYMSILYLPSFRVGSKQCCGSGILILDP